MYGTPGGLMVLEPLDAPAAAGPFSLASSPPQFYTRKSTFMHQHPNPPSGSDPGGGPASAPPAGSRPIWPQHQHQQHQQHQQLSKQDAPSSPRRNDLAAGPPSPRSRRSIGVGASYTAARLAPRALRHAVSSVAGVGDGGDAEEGLLEVLDLSTTHLPSMVPDEPLPLRPTAAPTAGSVAAAAAGSLFSPASGMLLRARDLPLLPSTPSTSQSRSVRTASISSQANSFAPQPPQSPPLPYYNSGSTTTAAADGGGSGGDSQLKVSYKAQMRRLRVAVLALSGVDGGPTQEDEDDEGYGMGRDDERPSGGGNAAGGRCRPLRERSSGGLGALDEVMPPRRPGTKAWGTVEEGAPGSLGSSSAKPSPSSGIGYSRRPEDLPAAPSPAHSRSLAGGGCGSGGSTPGTAGGGSASRLPLGWQPSNSSSCGSSSVGISRRPEDLLPAPNPAHSRSLAGGMRSGGSTPGSPVPVPVAGGSGSSSGGGGGPAAAAVQRTALQLPTQSHSQPQLQARSLQGGVAVAAGGFMLLQSPKSYPASHQQQPQQSSMPQWRPAGDAPLSPQSSISPATSAPYPAAPPQPAPPPALQRLPSQASRPSACTTSGEATSTSSTSTSTSSTSWHLPTPEGLLPGTGTGRSSGSGRALQGAGTGATAATPTAAAAPKPPQRQESIQGVGFSRRLEDLPAAPSPANSRSLGGGGANSSASSSRSWCEQQPAPPAAPLSPGGGGGGWRAPHSPAAAAAAGFSTDAARGSFRRVPDEMPAAPAPSQSRSLRPESRAAFRSHAAAAAGGRHPSTGVGPLQAPPSPLAWGPSTAGGGGVGLRLSLSSPAPHPPPSYYAGGGTATRQPQQQQRGLQQRAVEEEDVVDLPVVEGGILEDLSD